jgi:hypothetical protein
MKLVSLLFRRLFDYTKVLVQIILLGLDERLPVAIDYWAVLMFSFGML